MIVVMMMRLCVWIGDGEIEMHVARRGHERRGIEDGMMLVLRVSESLFYNGASFIYRNRSTLYVIRQDIGVGGLMRLR